jgi:DNA-binding SARP family transcriptional activator/tetratricopeptide (TPR) repeat protein
MVTLKLLGRLSLSDSNGPVTGQITQRRRLAFLAILGASPRATVTRDRLVALLWPELDAEGARHRLSDSLYVARRALGEEAIVTEGDDLRLSEEHVAVDTRAFERALDAGETALAMAQYGGPLLDGFHLGGEGEFDRWIEEERGRLAGRYAQSLRTIASAASQRGDSVAAGEYLLRLSALDPFDSRVVLQLMEVLERGGNGAIALRHARTHQTLRQTDLGLSEDPAVRAAEDALMARLARARAAGASAEPVAEVAAIAAGVAVTEPSTEPSTEPGPDHMPVTPALQRTASRRARVFLGAGVFAASAFALAVARKLPAAARVDASTASRGDSATVSVAPGVAVFPFIVRGSDSSAFTGDALAALIATKLDGGAGMRSIGPDAILARYRPGTEHPDPVDAARLARSLGARYFVLGDAMQNSGRLYLGAAMYDAADGTPVDARISVQGASAGFFELVDSLALRLLVERTGQPAPQLERLASVTTSSLPALKLFLEGESFSRAGQYEAAADRYERATIADSTFALGYYRLASVRSWRNGRGLDQSTLELAARHAARLPERIRHTLAALQAVGHGDFERGVRMLNGVIEQHPDDFDANLWLGDVLFHQNPPHGQSIGEARGPLERASVLAPARSGEVLFHLIELAARDGRMRDVDSLSTLFLALDQESDVAPIVRTILAVAHRDSTRLAVARRELGGMSPRAAMTVIGVVTSVAIGRANHVTIANLIASLPTPYPANERGGRLFVRAELAGADGDWRAADSLFDLAAAAKFEDATFARGRFFSLSSLDPPPAMMRRAIADLNALAISKPIDRGWADPFAAMLALRLGDTVPAAIALPRAVAAARTDSYAGELAVELSARWLLAIGKPEEALAVLLSPGGPLPNTLMRYLRGEVLEALHRPTEALTWYDASEQDYGFFTGAEWHSAAVARAHRRLDRP